MENKNGNRLHVESGTSVYFPCFLFNIAISGKQQAIL
jgi:hypothetical protein